MIKQYWDKYKDVILYLVFGVFTTVVNIVSYWLCAHVLGLGVMASSVIAWALAVFFAYVTNRTMVFHSSATGKGEILKRYDRQNSGQFHSDRAELCAQQICDL